MRVKKDPSGRPGLFLTGGISRHDIEKLQEISKHARSNRHSIQRFCQLKIMWFPNGKLVNDKELLATLDSYRKDEISKIFEEFENKSEEISNDVLDLLLKDVPERTLVTIMIQDSKNKSLFVGQIDEYREFFIRGTLAKRPNSVDLAICSVCNNKKNIGIFRERPLPFFFADKPMFFPDANPSYGRKGFPVCDSCYLVLQHGTQFIADKLSYSIPSIGSGRSDLKFWLIPHLNDQELMIDFKNDLDNTNLYLNSLRDLCQTLKTIDKYDRHDSKKVESFLRFSALFYSIDNRGLMRVTNYIQGIYPSQLQKLLDVKEDIDNLYPYPLMSKITGKNEFFVGLPLMTEFYKDVTTQWESQVVTLLESMFTGQKIVVDDVIKNIMTRVRETAKSYNMKLFTRILFLGMMLLEYLINLDSFETEVESKMAEQNAPLTKEVEHFQKFIASHSNIVGEEAERAVFAVGVCVGILLEVQSQRYNKVAPFWNRLNRLDLEPEKIYSLFTEVKSKLAMYGEERFNTIINYLAVNEISRMSNISKLTKDNLNLIFSIGLSYGYMLKRGILS